MKPLSRSSALPSRPIRWRFQRPAPAPYVWGESPIADMWQREAVRTQQVYAKLLELMDVK